MLIIREFNVTERFSEAFFESLFSYLFNVCFIIVFEGLCEKECKFSLNIYLSGIVAVDIMSLFVTYKDSIVIGFLSDYKVSHALKGITGNPNQIGMINLCGILVAVYLLVKCAAKKHTGKILLYSSGILFFTVILVMSYSRTSIISLICFVVFAVWLLPVCLIKDRKKAVVVFLSISMAVGIFVASLVAVEVRAAKKGSSFILSLLQSAEDTEFSFLVDKSGSEYEKIDEAATLSDYVFSDSFLSSRMKLWKNYIILLKDSPIIGIGVGYIRPKFIEMIIQGEESGRTSHFSLDFPFEHTHNGYIQVLISDGIPALVLFMLGIIAIVIKCFLVLLECRKLIDVAMVASILALIVYNLAEGSIFMEFRGSGLVIWIFAAFMCNVDLKKLKNSRKSALSDASPLQ